MLIRSRSIWALLLLTVLGLSHSRGDDGPPNLDSAGSATSATTVDPAFDRLVNLELLSQAIADLDASLAADVALQLANGERVLGRPHAAMTADNVLQLAIGLATQRRDAATIERLLTTSRSTGRTEWVAQLEAARSLLASSRAIEPEFDASGFSETALEFADHMLHGLRVAQLVGAAEGAQGFLSDIRESSLLTDAERQRLLSYCATITVTPREASDVDAASVALLLRRSRDTKSPNPQPGQIAIDITGGNVTTVLTKAEIEVTNQISLAYCSSVKIPMNGTLMIDVPKAGNVTVKAYGARDLPLFSGGTYREVYLVSKATVPVGLGLSGSGKRLKAKLKK